MATPTLGAANAPNLKNLGPPFVVPSPQDQYIEVLHFAALYLVTLRQNGYPNLLRGYSKFKGITVTANHAYWMQSKATILLQLFTYNSLR